MNDSYRDYGGRGIQVCHKWHSATSFLKWARSIGYRDDLTLDRKDHINLLGCGYDHPVSAHAAYQTLLRKRHDEAVRDTPQDPDYDPDDTFPQSYRYEYRLRRKCG